MVVPGPQSTSGTCQTIHAEIKRHYDLYYLLLQKQVHKISIPALKVHQELVKQFKLGIKDGLFVLQNYRKQHLILKV